MYQLKDKVVFISGGLGDIGQAIAHAFSSCGSNVVVGDLEDVLNEKFSKTFHGDSFTPCPVNIMSDESIMEAVNDIESRFGQIDVLVNSAGILCRKSFFDTSKKDFQKSLDVNVTGMFLLSQYFSQLMIKKSFGKIINIGSINGTLAIENRLVYGATKAAVNLLTQGMALELAEHNINVNCVAPGVVDSKMARVRLNTTEKRSNFAKYIPQNRLTLPTDVANCVLFLASPLASNITGETILVDGGLSVRQALPR